MYNKLDNAIDTIDANTNSNIELQFPSQNKNDDIELQFTEQLKEQGNACFICCETENVFTEYICCSKLSYHHKCLNQYIIHNSKFICPICRADTSEINNNIEIIENNQRPAENTNADNDNNQNNDMTDDECVSRLFKAYIYLFSVCFVISIITYLKTDNPHKYLIAPTVFFIFNVIMGASCYNLRCTYKFVKYIIIGCVLIYNITYPILIIILCANKYPSAKLGTILYCYTGIPLLIILFTIVVVSSITYIGSCMLCYTEAAQEVVGTRRELRNREPNNRLTRTEHSVRNVILVPRV